MTQMADTNPFSSIVQKLPLLRPRQLAIIERLIDSFVAGTSWWVNPNSDFASDEFAVEFGDILWLHHNASVEPVRKDKFEFALVDALNEVGYDAWKLPNGNPGEDIVVDGQPWSLKTQADRSIKRNEIHISKFMELGKGDWVTESDLMALRSRMFTHMESYERIFTLRCLTANDTGRFEYELVEIPKDLLLKARDSAIEMKTESRQSPKPALCQVFDADGLAFELYFDGGTERKLQIKHLKMRNCIVHARWGLTVNP